MFLIDFLRSKRILLLAFFCIIYLATFSQSKKTLEKQKQESLKRIQETEKIITETKTQRNATMGQLTVISKQIEARQDLINSITKEVKLLDEEISEKEIIIEALENDLEALKQEYAAMIYSAAKMDNSLNKLAFIFSAESFNQMIMRVKYFQQYADARNRQLEQIEKVKGSINQQRRALATKKSEKNALIGIHSSETENLSNLQKEKHEVVAELSKKETQLKKDLEETKQSLKKLENKIREIIEEERRKALAAAEAAKKKNTTGKNSASEGKALSSTFGGNQSKLPWPVAHGTVVRKYGRQKHPVLNIEENNLGVGIQTLRGEQVRAVFSGKVISINEIPGMNKIVMIQHGEYFTVYARLKKVYVKMDQQVSAKEVIGEVYTNSDDESQLEFQIWKGNSHLDPEVWMSRK